MFANCIKGINTFLQIFLGRGWGWVKKSISYVLLLLSLKLAQVFPPQSYHTIGLEQPSGLLLPP